MPRRAIVVLALACSAVPAAADTSSAPGVIHCVRTSHAACGGEDNICIGGLLVDRFTIVFDFGRQRFRSSWGRGRITRSWQLPDGSLRVLVSAPPASAEIEFSADYGTAAQRNGEAVTGYTCSRRR